MSVDSDRFVDFMEKRDALSLEPTQFDGDSQNEPAELLVVKALEVGDTINRQRPVIFESLLQFCPVGLY